MKQAIDEAAVQVSLMRVVGVAEQGEGAGFIDPRRSRTARLADRHLPIRIGTDAALELGVMPSVP
jgi:anaerobic selenocysteine-containing dehydrogenase